MNRALVFVCLIACTRSKEPTADTTASASASQSTPAPCGTLGGSCSQEGATCSPAPIGSGWSHTLMCHSGKWTEMEIAPLPQPQGKTQAPPRTLPKLETTCNADADCTVTTEEVQDDPPRTYACCSGCTQRAVNAAWLTRFRAACTASPAPMCPAIGCATMSAKAACRAHNCELAAK